MQYELKTIINGVAVYEEQQTITQGGVTYFTPSICNVKLQNNATTGTMEIGAAASDCLTFTLLNPFAQSFDGYEVELYVKPKEGLETDTKGEIEERVATGTAFAAISTVLNETNAEMDEEEGDPITAEELADVEATEAANTDATFIQLEGEADTTTPAALVTTEWHKVGVYYVQKQETSEDGKQVALTCYDGFGKLNGIWTPTNAEGTVQTLFNDLKAQALTNCGITIEAFEFDTTTNINITWNVSASYRTALGYFAGLAGGFAAFDADGEAGINFYTFTDNVLIKSDLLAYTEDSAGEILITELECNTATGSQEENIITAGAGQGVKFNNPFVTQGILEAILDDYAGTRLVGGTLTCKWEEGLIAGEFIKVFDPDEYANYLELKNAYASGTADVKQDINSLGAIMLISSQTITFDGEAVTTVTSVSESEYRKATQMTAPTISKIIEAGKTATNYITEEADGALVIRRDTDDYNVRIDADSLDVRNGERVLASFGEEMIIGAENDMQLTASSSGMYFGKNGISSFWLNPKEVTTEIVATYDTIESTSTTTVIALSNTPYKILSAMDAAGNQWANISDPHQRYPYFTISTSPNEITFPITVTYFEDASFIDNPSAELVGLFAANDYLSTTKSISLGTYVGAAILTGSTGSFYFSIPMGRVVPGSYKIKSISFDIVARATSHNSGGIYFIKSTNGGSNHASFSYEKDKKYSTSDPLMTFYNATNTKRTPTSPPTFKINGGTNLYISWITNIDYYFGGNATTSGYINNQACTVGLNNIEIEFYDTDIQLLNEE